MDSASTNFKTQNTKKKFPSQSWKRLGCAFLLLGILCRFIHLDQKIYWFDETFTALRVSGYLPQEVRQQVYQRETTVAELQKFQAPNPQKTPLDTLKNLAVDDAQNPPLYFLLESLWERLWGASVTVSRSLSATLSLLAFPCFYWLCWELFKSPKMSWLGVAFLAISPLHLVYAQEARAYALWSVTILFSSAALLRSIRRQKLTDWLLYGVSIALGLYTFLFTILVVISHGIYMVLMERFRWSRNLKNYGIANGLGFGLFLPWIVVILGSQSQVDHTTSWLQKAMDLPSLIKIWLLNLVQIFFYVDDGNHKIIQVLSITIGLVVLALIGYAFYDLCKGTDQRIWLFIVLLGAVSAIALILPDILLGGRRSTMARYFIPVWISVQLAMTYLLANKIQHISVQNLKQKFWRTLLVFLLFAGIVSDINYLQSPQWWNKFEDNHDFAVAKIINQSSNSLVISDAKLGNILSLSHQLSPQTKLWLLERKPNVTYPLPSNLEVYRDVFIFNPSSELFKDLDQQFPLQKLYKQQLQLWRVEKQR